MPLDVEASSLRSARPAIKALRTDQCMLLRGAIPADQLAAYGNRARAVFEEHARFRDQGEVPAGVPFSAVQQMANISMLEEKEDDLAFPLVEAIRRSAIWDIVTGYLRSTRVYCLIPISSVRKVTRERVDIAIPFHQDGFGLPEGPEFDMVSVWLLLDPEECGASAPNVEFVAGFVDRTLQLEPNPVSELFKHAQAENLGIDKLLQSGSTLWAPRVFRGDALIFTRFNLHRTFVRDSHTKPRYSIEIRFLANNPATTELCTARKSPLISIEACRAAGPTKIDWVGDGTRYGLLPWKRSNRLWDRIRAALPRSH